MKKYIILISVLLLGIIGFMGNKYYEENYKTEKYYVKVNEPTKADSGYEYHMTGYKINGDKKEIELNVDREKPLKKDAYLRVDYNNKKGAMSWVEIYPENVNENVKKSIENLETN